MTFKQIVKSVSPPVVWNLLRYARRRLDKSIDCLTYAPDGWATERPEESGIEDAWGRILTRTQEAEGRGRRIRWFQKNQPLLIAPEGKGPDQIGVGLDCIGYMTYAYVLALVARQKQAVKILDYGGALGEHYWLSRGMLPEVALEYHVNELPAVAEAGRELSPQIIWHTDDSCLDQRYDLVMFSSSLQYIKGWQDLLRRAAQAVGAYLFLTEISTVEHVSSYVAVQRTRGVALLHQQLNRADVLGTVHGTGLRLIREFLMGEHPPIANAPEQPSYRGWLFQREEPAG
jgi:putative methyltransferase (TIGR04325 family)